MPAGGAKPSTKMPLQGAALTPGSHLSIVTGPMPRQFQTLVELFQNSVEDFGAKEAFGEKQSDGSWKWVHFAEVGRMVEDARGGLALLGVGPGDKVAIVSDNRVEWAVLAFATFGLGAAYVPMYEAQKPDEWEFILADSGAKVVVGASNVIAEQLAQIESSLSTLEHVVGLELPADDPRSYKALLKRGSATPAAVHPVQKSDLAGLIYTSGTTGNPKGVELTHWNFSSNVLSAAERFDFTVEDTSLAFLPWAHSFGQTAELYTLLHYGATIAINDDVPHLITNLPEVRPTVLVAVPRIFNRIYDGVNKQIAAKPAPLRLLFRRGIEIATRIRAGESVGFVDKTIHALADKLIFSKVRLKFGGRLRFVVSGSAALSTEVASFIDALGIDVFEGYGLTETSPVVSANYEGNRKIGSIGKAFPGITVRIDHAATGDAVHGEIVVSGPNVMRGYHNRPEENAKVFCEDGAFRTGDMGYIDEDGFIFITGRIKEQYKLENGKYVVPSPLEEQLKLSPLIINVMIHGANRPHNVALVVPDMAALAERAARDGWDLGDAAVNPQVIELIRAELEKYSASFKNYERPKAFIITTEDFSTENGQLTPSLKVKRRAVLAQYGDALEALYRS